MKLGQEIVTCDYVDTANNPRRVTADLVNDNQEGTGYLAVTIAQSDSFHADDTNNATNVPVPKVQLVDRLNPSAVGGLTPTANDSYLRIYGALATFNEATGRCGVITTGIVPFRTYRSTSAADIGTGITAPPAADHTTSPGYVGAGTSGTGRGTIIGRSNTPSQIFWVDLDAEQAAV